MGQALRVHQQMNKYRNYSDEALENARQEAAGYLAVEIDEDVIESWADEIFFIEEEQERRGS
jgi:hypothetical protein